MPVAFPSSCQDQNMALDITKHPLGVTALDSNQALRTTAQDSLWVQAEEYHKLLPTHPFRAEPTPHPLKFWLVSCSPCEGSWTQVSSQRHLGAVLRNMKERAAPGKATQTTVHRLHAVGALIAALDLTYTSLQGKNHSPILEEKWVFFPPHSSYTHNYEKWKVKRGEVEGDTRPWSWIIPVSVSIKQL